MSRTTMKVRSISGKRCLWNSTDATSSRLTVVGSAAGELRRRAVAETAREPNGQPVSTKLLTTDPRCGESPTTTSLSATGRFRVAMTVVTPIKAIARGPRYPRGRRAVAYLGQEDRRRSDLWLLLRVRTPRTPQLGPKKKDECGYKQVACRR